MNGWMCIKNSIEDGWGTVSKKFKKGWRDRLINACMEGHWRDG